MADFGRCTDPSCSDEAVRLFHCAHHCAKMVCLHHLIDHDRSIERDRQQLENSRNELKRFSSIYSSLVDEEKLRLDYEQKLQEYKRFVFDVSYYLENKSNDMEQIQAMIEKLKKAIQERQKPPGESPTIVKVEPVDETMQPSPPAETSKDELLYIGFDRLQNLVIDTDYHRRKMLESTAVKIKSESPMIIANDEGRYSINTEIHIRKIRGLCPLWIDGAYGFSQQHHCFRLCQKRRFSDLNDHLRRYHGLLAPIANVVSRAVHSKIPVTKRLFPTTIQVIDPHRSFLCPLNSECQYHFWLPARCLKSHLVEVHHMSEIAAEMKTNNVKLSSRGQSNTSIKTNALKVIRKLESTSVDENTRFHLKRKSRH